MILKNIVFCNAVIFMIALVSYGAVVYASSGVEVGGDLLLQNGGVAFSDGTIQTAASMPTWSQKILGAARWLTVLDDAAVLDRETGLVWQRQTSGITKVEDDAIASCTILSVGGRFGWRLPSIEELATLIDPNAGSAPYLPAGHLFTDDSAVLGGIYWSSTTSTSDSTRAWLAYFSGGYGVVTI
ncbi:MAG TPA: DUF1566 domain-containing protein [Thermodesulfovibrionales bacterium]|nr:DUF1566 domain-containing protein [Thermodesulfovibrionales bacterium]